MRLLQQLSFLPLILCSGSIVGDAYKRLLTFRQGNHESLTDTTKAQLNAQQVPQIEHAVFTLALSHSVTAISKRIP